MGSGKGFTMRNFIVCTVHPNIVRVIQSRRLRWAGLVARMEEGRSILKMLIGTPTGKRPLGRPRSRWEDNIRMDIKRICINTKNCVDSAQDRDYWRTLLNAALNLQASQVMELVIQLVNNRRPIQILNSINTLLAECLQKYVILRNKFTFDIG